MSENPYFTSFFFDHMFFGFSFIISLVLLAFMIRRSNLRLDREAGREPLYKVACSGQIGWWRYRGPLIKVRMYEDFLVIVAFHHQILIHYDDIDAIVPSNSFFRWGIYIKHHDPNAPSRIRLRMNSPEMMAVFEQYKKSA